MPDLFTAASAAALGFAGYNFAKFARKKYIKRKREKDAASEAEFSKMKSMIISAVAAKNGNA